MPDNSTFPVTQAQLTGMFLQAICFGILLVTFGFCLHALFTYRGRLRQSREINWLMVSVSSFSFMIATLDLSLGFYHNLEAFIFYKGPGGPIEEFSNISDWVNITKSVALLIQTTLGDAMLVYRCWIVWNRGLVPILVSLILWLATCSMAIWIIYLESTLKSKLFITAKQLLPAGTAFWALSISLTIITTGLLVYRIWTVELENKRIRVNSGGDRPTGLGQVMRYIIESGLLYTVTSIITFITVVTSSNGSYPISDAEIMIIPIAFNLIIIRTSRIAGGSESSTYIGSHPSGTVPLQFVPRAREDSTTATKTDGIRVMMTQSSIGDYTLDKESA